jgi:hypothetical protein
MFVGIMAGGFFLVFSGIDDNGRLEKSDSPPAMEKAIRLQSEIDRTQVSQPSPDRVSGTKAALSRATTDSSSLTRLADGADDLVAEGDFGIEGVVFALDSGQPLAGCRVSFRDRVMETGDGGGFEFWSVGAVGRLSFSCSGYKSEAIDRFDNRVGEGVTHMDVFLGTREGRGPGRIEINGVSGRVYDRESGAPLGGVRIAIGRRLTKSDEAGFFELWGNDSILSTLQATAPGYVGEMVSGIDFTNQANPFFFEISLQRNRQGKFHLALVGIGARLARSRDGYIIAEVLKDSPAAREGLRAGDRLVAVDSLAVDDFSLREVIELIRGRDAQPVKLMVERDGDFLEFICIRERVVY